MPPSGPLRRPRALRPGDRVAVLSLSGTVPADRLAIGLAALRFAGLEPVVHPTAHDDGSLRRYLAGADEQRAAELTSALLDDDVRAIVFARGGYGAQRTLELLDWTLFAGVAPKVLVGFSDLTAMLEAVAAKLGWVSLLGPTVTALDDGGQYSRRSLLRALMTPEGAQELVFPDALTVVGGRAHGVTCGGNLAMLASSIGTGTSWPARGGILLIEDVGEADYRIDRMLTQLRRSGYLDGVAGVVCGTWERCGREEGVERDHGREAVLTVDAVLIERLGSLGVPLLLRADVGHGGRIQTFPLGLAATLDADAKTVTFDEPPLEPAT